MAIVGQASPRKTLETFRDLTEGLDKAGLLIHTMGKSALESYSMALNDVVQLYAEDSAHRQQLVEHLSRPKDVEIEHRTSGPSTSVRAIVLGATAVASNYLSVGLRYDNYGDDLDFCPTRLSVGIKYTMSSSSYAAVKNWCPPLMRYIQQMDQLHERYLMMIYT